MPGVFLTRLIGRERELVAIRQRLLDPRVRLLTLVGPPGIGKTRLGLAVADQLSVEASAGVGPASIEAVSIVPLAPVREPALVASAIAQSLGIGEAGRQPVLESVRAMLRERPFLLVLDNVEHLSSAASLVAELLAACPRLKILATSRAPLHVYGEQSIRFRPWRCPISNGPPRSRRWPRCPPSPCLSSGPRRSGPTSS